MALSDDIVGYIEKDVIQFCPKISHTVWSDCRHDGMIFLGHPRVRSGQA